jgi:hypothetical protein
MNTIDTILTRHSTREYNPSQKATAEQIITDARQKLKSL